MIPLPNVTVRFEGALEEGLRLRRFADEVQISPEFLHRVADDVFAAEALEAFAQAETIPLASSTIERKARAARSPPGRKGNRRTPSSPRPLDPVAGATGLFAALTTGWEQHSPVALREFSQHSLLFGTQRWVDRYAGAHYWGVPRHALPARLDWLRTSASQQRAEELLREVMADHVFRAMERAGYARDQIVAAFDADPDFAGRY